MTPLLQGRLAVALAVTATMQVVAAGANGGQAFRGTGARVAQASSASEEGGACATIATEAKNVLPANAAAAGIAPPVVVGTESNLDPKLKELGFDFSGLWWMRGNKLPEVMVSFAGSTLNSSTFPVRLAMPNNRKGRWSWLDTAGGLDTMKRYSTADPDSPNLADFMNSTYGEVVPSDVINEVFKKWQFIYLNEDEWLRQNLWRPNPFNISTTHYTLTRIVRSDGSPHPKFWPLFMEHLKSSSGELGGQRMIFFSSDNSCLRQCEISQPCSVCKQRC